MTNKKVVKKSLGFSLIVYFSIIFLLLVSSPFLFFIMILDDLLFLVVVYSPIFYFITFIISYSIFKKDPNKSKKRKYDGICIFLGRHTLLIISTFVLFCLFLFYSLIFYMEFDVTLKGFFVCENDFTFSKSVKSYGKFFITNRGVCVQESVCEKLEGFAECEELKENGYYSKVVLKGADKNNFDFKFLTGLKKTENSKEEFIISDLGDEFNLPKYTCTQTQCDFNTSGKIDFYQMKRYGMLLIKDNDVAIFLRSQNVVIFKDVDLDNFQFEYLGEKYLKVQNQVYYNNDRIFVESETFQYLGGKYSKDKNNVYYKNEIITADPETFIYEKGRGKAIGKGRDKNGTWIKGALKESDKRCPTKKEIQELYAEAEKLNQLVVADAIYRNNEFSINFGKYGFDEKINKIEFGPYIPMGPPCWSRILYRKYDLITTQNRTKDEILVEIKALEDQSNEIDIFKLKEVLNVNDVDIVISESWGPMPTYSLTVEIVGNDHNYVIANNFLVYDEKEDYKFIRQVVDSIKLIN